MTVLGCVFDKRRNEVLNWIEVPASSGSLTDFVEEVRRSRQVLDADVVRLKSRMLGVVKNQRCPIWAALEGLPCIIRTHTVRPDGSAELIVLADSTAPLKRLTDRLRSQRLNARIQKITRVHNVDSVTDGQRRVVRLALEHGYFDYPRRIRQRQLSALCGLSSSTLTETLRRAEKHIVSRYLEGEETLALKAHPRSARARDPELARG